MTGGGWTKDRYSLGNLVHHDAVLVRSPSPIPVPGPSALSEGVKNESLEEMVDWLHNNKEAFHQLVESDMWSDTTVELGVSSICALSPEL